MAILAEWDGVGEKIYETGVDRGMLYVWDPTLNDGDGGYGAGVVWNGLTSINDSPSGADPTDLWADNQKYLSIRAAEEYGFTINAYQSPEEFDVCDGMASPVTGVKIGQQNRRMFAFCYRTLIGNDTDFNDHGYKIHIIYGATASPSDKDRSTVNDSPDAVEFSWECTSTPQQVEGYRPSSVIEIDSRNFTGANEALLTSFEEIIYGKKGTGSTADTPASIPSIEDVIAHFTPGP